jgi:vacuolar-type H+-ATPase subunit E/Vma4
MTLDPLLAALRHQADAEREQLLAAARAEAGRLVSEAEARTRTERTGQVDARRSAFQSAAELRAADARRTARRGVIEARQRLLDRVFGAALDLIPEAGVGLAYRATLPARLRRALACTGDAPVAIHGAPGIAAELGSLTAAQAHCVVRAAPEIRAGLRLATVDGRLDVDDTLEGQLERRRPELSLGVLADFGAAV